MAGDSRSGGGIPSWQRQQQPDQKPLVSDQCKSTESNGKENDNQGDAAHGPDVDRSKSSPPKQATLVEQASRFLQDERIRDASPEAKLAFLTSKGLDEASLEKTRHLVQPSPQASQPSQPISPSSSEPQPPSTAPPIITYPEFLLHSRKPPPLITARRIFNTAYAFTGVAALVYGISHYLINPMSESLTESRHDFATNAQQRLDELNEKLLETVSTDPSSAPSIAAAGTRRKIDKDDEDAADDGASDDSDPTELFHRDFGTQTSTPPPASTSSNSSDTGQPTTERDATSAATASLSRLRSLASSLSADHLASETDTAQEISTVVRVLDDYLHSMTYPSSSNSTYGGGVVDMTAGYGVDGMPRKTKEGDEVANLRAEIRSVKGVLLSARNFPGGVGAGAGMGAGVNGGGRRAMFPPVGGQA